MDFQARSFRVTGLRRAVSVLTAESIHISTINTFEVKASER